MEWMVLPLKRYAQFSGRSRPKEFWMFFLFLVIGIVVLSFVDSALGLGGSSNTYADAAESGVGGSVGFSNTGGVLTGPFCLAMFVPYLAVAIRRLHDTDRVGWWVLIGLIPLIGGIVLIVFFAQGGTRGPNQYGPDPFAAST